MNLEWLLEYNPVLLALVATLFTWGVSSIPANKPTVAEAPIISVLLVIKGSFFCLGQIVYLSYLAVQDVFVFYEKHFF